MWHHSEPYNDLPDPPSNELETRAVLKATTEARAAIAALDQAVNRLPNPSILLNAVTLLEAQASSEIENIVTTTDELFQLASVDSAQANPAAKETLRYRAALYAGMESLKQKPLSGSLAAAICTEINGRMTRIRELPGTYIGDPSTREIRYTPPDGPDAIAAKLSSWEKFVHNDHDLDPLVTMSAAHYQFEAIHPFPDGNGRTGRILNVLMLIEAGLLTEPVLYLSRYVIENKNKYYDLLLDVTAHGEWEKWLLFMLAGLEATARYTLELIDRIQQLQGQRRRELRELTTIGANSDLMDLLFERPYCRTSDVVERCDVSRQTAAKWLKELVSLSILQTIKVGRERLYINTRLISVLSRTP